MTGQNYAMEIKRTASGAVNDYHYYRAGCRIRSQAFHAFMKRLRTRFAGEAQVAQSTLTVGLRWEPEPSH